MTRIFVTNTVIGASILGLTFAAAVVAQADQLSASAGLTSAEAASMSLTDIAAAKFNRDTGRDGQQAAGVDAPPVRVDSVRHAQLIASAGLTPEEAEGMTLSALTAGKFSSGSSDDQVIVTMSSRGPVRIGSQLAASAGLSDVEAQGMSLTAIAAAKFNRESGRDNDQTPGF